MTAGSADTALSGVSSGPSALPLMPFSGRPNRGFGRQPGRAGEGRRCAGPTAASRRGGIGAERRTTSVASRPRHPRFWPPHGSVRL